MKTPQNKSQRQGFTLVELLVAMTVIGILVGMLAVGVNAVLTRSREFTIQTELTQLESAIEQFKTKYGFYPPSFREMEDLHFEVPPADGGGPQGAANLMLSYLNRIAPNHIEGSGTFPNRPVDIWWANVGSQRTAFETTTGQVGSDLMFWLCGIAKNKQRPLTRFVDTDNDGIPDTVLANAAHNKTLPGIDDVERDVLYEFPDGQLTFIDAGQWAQYNQPVGREIPYLYLDRNNYLPSLRSLNPSNGRPYDGAYCGPVDTLDYPGDYQDILLNDNIQDRRNFIGSNLFKQMFPNPDSFQLVTFGVDSEPGETEPVNLFILAGPDGADNIVNFGNQGPIKLEALIEEAQ